MKVYVIINDRKRVEFENKFQISYGHRGLPIFFDLQKAIDCFHINYDDPIIDHVGQYIYDNPKDMVIECCENGTRQIVYTM